MSKKNVTDFTVKPLSFNIADIHIMPSFISLSVEWLSLPIRMRQNLCKELLKESLDFPDEVLFLYIIIPYENGYTDFSDTFLFLSMFPCIGGEWQDENVVADLEKFARGEDSDISCLCKRLNLDTNKLLNLSARIEPFEFIL